MADGKNTLLVTGGAGFIGFHTIKYILENYKDVSITAVDNLNDYYEVSLKKARLEQLSKYPSDRFSFHQLDIAEKDKVAKLFKENNFSHVVNLAAQAGVRYARKNPDSYLSSNLNGFFNVIDSAAKHGTGKFIYASSSSVYGSNSNMPFKESDLCASPMSLYAATKLGDEAIAASYFYTGGLSTVGLRFFNVYGPWGRPDMAYYKWTEALLGAGEIELRDKGEMYRDMTYIDDAVKVLTSLLFEHQWPDGHEIYNVGNKNPIKIKDMLDYLQEKLETKSDNIIHTEKGAEEPLKTFASTEKLQSAIGFAPDTDYKEGLDAFLAWYKTYHHEERV